MRASRGCPQPWHGANLGLSSCARGRLCTCSCPLDGFIGAQSGRDLPEEEVSALKWVVCPSVLRLIPCAAPPASLVWVQTADGRHSQHRDHYSASRPRWQQQKVQEEMQGAELPGSSSGGLMRLPPTNLGRFADGGAIGASSCWRRSRGCHACWSREASRPAYGFCDPGMQMFTLCPHHMEKKTTLCGVGSCSFSL